MNSGSNEWPAPPPPVQQSREPLFRSFLRSINRSPRAEAQAQALSAIPTPSECSLVSFCISDHESDSEEEIIYENVEPRENCPSRESISEHSIQEPHNSFVDSSLESNQLSLTPVYAEMEDQVSQLCRAVERMQASVNSQGRNVGVKSSVTFPVFRGDECEDAHEFIRNYKRAGRLNGWDDNNLALGLPLYLRADVSKYRPEVYKSEKSKIIKKIHKVALGKLLT